MATQIHQLNSFAQKIFGKVVWQGCEQIVVLVVSTRDHACRPETGAMFRTRNDTVATSRNLTCVTWSAHLANLTSPVVHRLRNLAPCPDIVFEFIFSHVNYADRAGMWLMEKLAHVHRGALFARG